MEIGFIGLGVMGSAMAGHLAKGGHALALYDIAPAAARKVARRYKGARAVRFPREVAEASEVVFTMLPEGTAVRECVFGADGLAAVAPALARGLHPNDEIRVIRALERVRAGATSQERWQRPESPWSVTCIGLTLERAELARRLAARTRSMVAAGLLDETRELLRRGYGAGLTAMQGIGYRQFVDVAAGRLDAAAALALMERDTVRYARRQMTWFTREPGVAWLDVAAAGGAPGVAAAIAEKIGKAEKFGKGGEDR